MPRKHDFPDPKDRSINAPTVIMSNTKVLSLYNQNNPKEKATYVSDSVKKEIKENAKGLGWNEATFHGNQCVLEVQLNLVTFVAK